MLVIVERIESMPKAVVEPRASEVGSKTGWFRASSQTLRSGSRHSLPSAEGTTHSYPPLQVTVPSSTATDNFRLSYALTGQVL